LNEKIIEVNITILRTRCETHIIFPPINASDLVDVTFTLEVLWAIFSIKVVNKNSVQTNCTSEHMATIAEFYFSATLNGESSGAS